MVTGKVTMVVFEDCRVLGDGADVQRFSYERMMTAAEYAAIAEDLRSTTQSPEPIRAMNALREDLLAGRVSDKEGKSQMWAIISDEHGKEVMRTNLLPIRAKWLGDIAVSTEGDKTRLARAAAYWEGLAVVAKAHSTLTMEVTK
jgi:hypothetical protein